MTYGVEVSIVKTRTAQVNESGMNPSKELYGGNKTNWRQKILLLMQSKKQRAK